MAQENLTKMRFPITDVNVIYRELVICIGETRLRNTLFPILLHATWFNSDFRCLHCILCILFSFVNGFDDSFAAGFFTYAKMMLVSFQAYGSSIIRGTSRYHKVIQSFAIILSLLQQNSLSQRLNAAIVGSKSSTSRGMMLD